MLQVGVVGYGTIGKRIADAIRAQPDMRVAGVAKTTPDATAGVATDRGFSLYAADTEQAAFEAAGLTIAGELADLVTAADVVIDATPAGIGADNRRLYEACDTPAIYQGGEAPDVAETSFTARANFDDAVGAESIRVVSCNTTGLARLLTPLDESIGVDHVHATLVRRGGDPVQSGRGPINDILPDPVTVPSHHGPDVQTVLPELSITTMGLTVPATLMHVHAVSMTFDRSTTAADVTAVLERERRIRLVSHDRGLDGTATLRDHAHDRGRPRGDVPENCVWTESIAVEGRRCYCFQAIHQESDVVPENIDAVRAITGGTDRAESMARTDEALGLDRPVQSTATPGNEAPVRARR